MIKKTIEEKYHDLVNLILQEAHSKIIGLEKGIYSTKQGIHETSGAIKQLGTLIWHIESNRTKD